jgi:hypothetical protein
VLSLAPGYSLWRLQPAHGRTGSSVPGNAVANCRPIRPLLGDIPVIVRHHF